MSDQRNSTPPVKANGQSKKPDHQRFAEKSQMLRWFHERNLNELKAMRKGFEFMLERNTTKGGRA